MLGKNNHVLRIDDKLYAKFVLVYSKRGPMYG